MNKNIIIKTRKIQAVISTPYCGKCNMKLEKGGDYEHIGLGSKYEYFCPKCHWTGYLWGNTWRLPYKVSDKVRKQEVEDSKQLWVKPILLAYGERKEKS